MRRNLSTFPDSQVFLNYPFDSGFNDLERALHFAIIAAGLLPICAKDLSAPDSPRLEMLVKAIQSCRYSAHDLSRATGEGPNNYARMNMPIEMGMALFYAIATQRIEHRCAFLLPTQTEYRLFASDLAGLDPLYHNNDSNQLLSAVFNWLRGVLPAPIAPPMPTVEVVQAYGTFCELSQDLLGSGENGAPSHEEIQELMYQSCADQGWWEWRKSRMVSQEFPVLPLAWRTTRSVGDEIESNQRSR